MEADKDFKFGNIYVFIMDADPEHSTVLVNGNSFDLNGGNLKLKDYSLEGNDKTIAGLFNRELAGRNFRLRQLSLGRSLRYGG